MGIPPIWKNWQKCSCDKIKRKLTMTNHNLDKSNWLEKRELEKLKLELETWKTRKTWQLYIRVARTHANNQKGDLQTSSVNH